MFFARSIRRWLVPLLGLVLAVVVAAPALAGVTGYKIGQSGESSDLVFTVYGFQEPVEPTNQFLTPDAGTHWVAVDVEVKNPSKSQKVFSSLMSFHLQDKQNREFDPELVTGVEPGAPDGQIPGKGAIRGWVVFQVPDGSPTPYRFRAQGSFTASGAVWKLKPAPPA